MKSSFNLNEVAVQLNLNNSYRPKTVSLFYKR